MQLSLFSTPVSAVCMMLYDHEALYERNLLVGFSRVIWLAVSLNALGGIAVSMALKCVGPPCARCTRCTRYTLCALYTRCTLCTQVRG